MKPFSLSIVCCIIIQFAYKLEIYIVQHKILAGKDFDQVGELCIIRQYFTQPNLFYFYEILEYSYQIEIFSSYTRITTNTINSDTLNWIFLSHSSDHTIYGQTSVSGVLIDRYKHQLYKIHTITATADWSCSTSSSSPHSIINIFMIRNSLEQHYHVILKLSIDKCITCTHFIR